MKTVLVLLVALAAGGAALAATVPPAAPTRTAPVVDSYFGVKVADPYRWLENANDPEVRAWSSAQNARSRAYLDALATREPIRARLKALVTQTSPSWSVLGAYGKSIFAYYNDPAFQQPRLVTVNQDADPASIRVVLDPNAMDPKGLTAIDWAEPSPDGTLVAVSISKNGSEDGTLHVYAVATGREVDVPIPHVQYPTGGGSLAWAADGMAFWYTRYPGDEAPEADRHFNMQAYFHRLGGDWKTDPVALATSDGLPRTAEIFLDNRSAQGAALASVQLGDGNQWQHFVLKPDGVRVQVGRYEDQIVAAALGPDGSLYGVSRKGAPNGKVVKTAGIAPFSGASVIVPESGVSIVTDSQTRSFTLTAHRLFVRDIDGGPSRVRIFDLGGKPAGSAPVPDIADIDQMAALANGDVIFRVSTYTRPRYFARWSASDGKVSETALAITSPISFDDVEVVRAFAVSKDGTKAPLNIVRRKGLKLDGSHPVLLEGYGGYGVNQTPAFLGAMRRLWLDAGGVYVEANLRGGGEYGERWHQAGMLTRKQNVFDDFAAASAYLVKAGYTSPGRTAWIGGSNGGLLMGAALTQHPDRARAVVSQVGIYDMLRVELDPNGAFNVSEYGTVKDRAEFRALYAYSPYHRVRAGVRYPSVLMMTGDNDGRVNPLNSRKFTAALQAATAAGDHPILLRTSSTSGHGIGSSLDERIGEQADILAYLFDQLGMSPPASEP